MVAQQWDDKINENLELEFEYRRHRTISARAQTDEFTRCLIVYDVAHIKFLVQ